MARVSDHGRMLRMASARPTKNPLDDLQRDVLKQLVSDGPQELEDLAEKWWGSDRPRALAELEALAEAGLVHAQHLYPGQLLFQRIDPHSEEGRARGARSFFKVTTEGRRSVR